MVNHYRLEQFQKPQRVSILVQELLWLLEWVWFQLVFLLVSELVQNLFITILEPTLTQLPFTFTTFVELQQL